MNHRAVLAVASVLLVPVLALVPLLGRRAAGQDRSRQVTSTSGDRPAPVAPLPPPRGPVAPDIAGQGFDEVAAKSNGCITCHQGAQDPHTRPTVRLGCTDCHGGDARAAVKEMAHVRPRYPEAWPTAGNPVRSYALLNHESPEFTRFVNPGDLRVAHVSCGTSGCHPSEVLNNRKSMMTHGAMLWGAALYNNGSFPLKRARFGESYSMDGTPQRIQTVPPPTEEEIRTKGVLPYLDPLPRFENSQPGNVLRIFERGGRGRAEVGIPDIFEDPGRPRIRLSNRGLGTLNRTDPVFLGLQKTRLFDPTLNFLGTNDHPGDYRSSGCTACHVVYANDRSPVHSGPFAGFGNRGLSFSTDPTIRKDEPGHPIAHRFVTAPPTSQCIVCHVHPGTNVMNSYLGYMWWDNETDGELMYPKAQKYPSAEEMVRSQMNNPDETAAKGLWSDPAFLANVSDLNPRLRHTQFADFHGHGWVFRSVFKKDRKGNLLDAEGDVVPSPTTAALMAGVAPPTPEERAHGKSGRKGVPVHLMDIHIEKGMHCVDCHFQISAHGNGKLYGEVRNAIEIGCIDCHGTSRARTNLRTTGPASPEGGVDLAALRTPFQTPRFERRGDDVYQNSMVEPKLRWRVVQTTDTIDPSKPRDYNQKSRMAKTVRREGRDVVWGDLPADGRGCPHAEDNMSCTACHSSWNPSCYGCHLPQKANMKMPELHNLGDVSRNYVSYNFQTLRDDVFMLARDGDVTGNRINPARSSCAIHVGSYNAKRESIYVQQQTISAEGFAGIAFSTNVPHTVRGGPRRDPDTGRPVNPANFMPGRNETKQCTDCHVAKDDDNNAVLAQLMMQGTNYVNFIGRYCWVGSGGEGVVAAIVTEREEPQAVIGSSLHRVAYPDNYRAHVEAGRVLKFGHEHRGSDVSTSLIHPLRKPDVRSLQARGEYLYAACGGGGLRVFDIAFIDDKAFSERITTAPVSPLGQRFFVRTKNATAVAAPTTVAPDPTRTHRDENREVNRVHAMYGYIYVADAEEGLITVPAATLLDGDPLNNFLDREVTFNPGGILCGARSLTILGTYAYVTCNAGLVVVSLDDPKHPSVTSVVGRDAVNEPVAFQAQFRYGYACDKEGIVIFDVTDPAHPRALGRMALEGANNIYLARTHAYVAAGRRGLVILDIERPASPRIDQVYDAGGRINDARDVKLGITNVSEFAYVADGRNGMRVVQLTSPETPGNDGFSPRPTPQLIATYPMRLGGEALAISEGVDRDRAVDESGNQLSVFGRVGARPLSRDEQRRMYLHEGRVWQVSDDPLDPIYPPARPFQR